MMRTRSLSLIAVFVNSFPSMLLIYAITTTASKTSLPRCHEDERSVLLEFKQSFDTYQDNPLFVSWNPAEGGEEGNCCSWHGVECDQESGHVIGLDLNDPHYHRTSLVSSINSTSSLFRLIYLKKLHLYGFFFNNSLIPSAIGNFSRLEVLNLSESGFTGQVPPEILGLASLSSLDLSGNSLMLEKQDVEDLAQSLTKLEQLNLGGINISVPIALANLTSLKLLAIPACNLQGEFLTSILKLPNLQVLDVSGNENLSLPTSTSGETAGCASLRVFDLSDCNLSGLLDLEASLGNCTKLTTLRLARNRFHGNLPSFVNLNKLTELDLSDNALTGEIPSSFGNLNKLTELHLSGNALTGEIPSSFGNLSLLSVLDLNSNRYSGKLPSFVNLSQLTVLDLAANAFTGEIPSSYGNLTMLYSLRLESNRLSGQIPFSIGHLHQLSTLYLDGNSLTGSIPPSFGCLTSLYELPLSYNQLTGPIPSSLGNLSQLHELDLIFNRLTGPIPSSIGNLTQLVRLYLISNQLNGIIPSSIGKLSYLSDLDISSNRLVGQIPSSLGKLASLVAVNLSQNHLTGLADDSLVNLTAMTTIDLSFNNLHGLLPTPPTFCMAYFISNNRLFGELPSLICNLSEIFVLDLANNNFNGMVPQCLSNLGKNLEMLSLHDNNFSGAIPQLYPSLCALTMMDISHNRLRGPLPPSLANCTRLVFLNFGNNLIDDTFPSWMGSLSELKILMLGSNVFHGEILQPKHESEFAKLHIIDVSNNNFVGSLPFNCSKCWKGMGGRNADDENSYIVQDLIVDRTYNPREYDYSMTIINKGLELKYDKIRGEFIVIDFSSNNFSGEIPATFGSLQGLHLLNLSHNLLTGHIPPVLSNLTQIEALDVSRNMLSGDIPYQLTILSSLEVFNVSYNQLSGAIPRGKQFDAFDNSSYVGNVGLCGEPLSKKCGGTDKEAPPSENLEKGSNVSFEFDWKIILMGFASGTIIGVVLGQGMTVRQDNWIVTKLKHRVRTRRR